jgi:arabinogalactan endo-1,4-beta-galactosidase
MKQWMIILCMIFTGATDVYAQQREFMKGADVSWLQEVEAGGGVFREQGNAKDALVILRKNGFNYLRLRLWHTPAHGVNDLQHTLAMALRAKANGFKILIDLHFSDWWADPGNQTIPAAWKGLPFGQLKDSVRQYVTLVFSMLKEQGTLPSMVQFGNEIICGMLWNEGNVCGTNNTPAQWTKLGELLHAARKGMDDAVAPTDTIRVMIHIDAGGNYSSASWFFDHLITYYNAFDVIGLSFYPWWHGSIDAMKENTAKLAVRYSKDIILAEVAYPFTLSYNDSVTNIVGTASQLHIGYPATVEGQKQYLTNIIAAVKNIPMQRGQGLFYWESDGISAPGWASPWENLALFGFDGEVLPSIQAFRDSTVSVVEYSATVPEQFTLSCFPNPFNPSSTVLFTVTEQITATLTLYNALGQTIRRLYHDVAEPGREYRIPLDGHGLAGGLYFVRLESGGRMEMIKTVLMK